MLDEESTDKKSSHYRILVVDDNEACAKTTMWTLELLGHTAQIALNGQDAIALAGSFYPDVILLDIGMPKINGYELCQAMRKNPDLQNSIFVAYTGWGQKEDQKRSLDAGFDYHLVKPVNMESLKTLLFSLDKNKAVA